MSLATPIGKAMIEWQGRDGLPGNHCPLAWCRDIHPPAVRFADRADRFQSQGPAARTATWRHRYLPVRTRPERKPCALNGNGWTASFDSRVGKQRTHAVRGECGALRTGCTRPE